MRGEPRDVRFRRPRCWFLPLAQVCPAAMPPRAILSGIPTKTWGPRRDETCTGLRTE